MFRAFLGFLLIATTCLVILNVFDKNFEFEMFILSWEEVDTKVFTMNMFINRGVLCTYLAFTIYPILGILRKKRRRPGNSDEVEMVLMPRATGQD